MDEQTLVSTGTKSILGEYADLRWQMAVLEAKLKEIEPLAIETAMNVVGSGQSPNGKRVAYRTEHADITLQFRTSEPKPGDHADLQTYKELIEIESEKACRANADVIAQVQQQIAVLEAQLVGLMQTDDGLELVAEYEELKQQLTTKKPMLSVRLK